MATKIRLARAGSKKRPYYRIVVADSKSPRDGRFIEKIGAYNPMLAKDHKDRVVLSADRLQHWLDQGAIPTGRVAIFCEQLGLGQESKVLKEINAKRAKVIELKKAEIEAKKAEEAAKAKAEAEAKAAEEAAAAAEAAQEGEAAEA